MRYRLSLLLLPGLLSGLLAGCLPDADPVSPAVEAAAFSLLGGLEVGESLILSGDQARNIYLNGGGGNEYLYVPFYAADSGSVKLQVEVEGSNLQGRASAARVPLHPAGSLFASAASAQLPVDRQSHLRLRQWEQQRLAGLARRGATGGAGRAQLRQRMQKVAARTAAVVPRVGEIVPVRVPNRDPANFDICENPKERHAHVVAVTRRAIILEDVRNPVRLSAADVARIADEFERFVYPVNATNFGEPTDIDENERVMVLITSALNETARRQVGVTVGFAFALDLLPRSIPEWQYECAASNEGEIFYVIAPDPAGEVTGGLSIPTNFVAQITSTVVVHELQHVINFGRRLYLVQGAEEFEDLWLNEGLSHMAEELLFYAVTGLQPRSNLDRQTLQSSPEIRTAFNRFQADNVEIFGDYLKSPDGETLMGRDPRDDSFATRGAAWAFLRYAADHDERPDADFFRALVNSPVAGMRNLDRVLRGDPRAWMQRWTVSNYTDDLVEGADTLFTQPSWNYRSLFEGGYPLLVHSLEPNDELPLTLQGGGASYVHLRALQERQALVTAGRSGTAGPGQLRVSVIRVR